MMDYANLLRVVAAIVSCCGAVFLASKSVHGWGWFLFAAIILGTTTVKV